MAELGSKVGGGGVTDYVEGGSGDFEGMRQDVDELVDHSLRFEERRVFVVNVAAIEKGLGTVRKLCFCCEKSVPALTVWRRIRYWLKPRG